MVREETRPLLPVTNGRSSSSSSSSPSSASRPAYGSFEVRSGYELSPSGLSNLVAQSQFGFLRSFNGASGLATSLGCQDPSAGLPSSFDFSRQRTLYGSNGLELPPEPSLLALLIEGVQDITLVMLICSALVSLFLGLVVERDFEHGWIEGVSILVTVAVVLNVAALTDYTKAKEFRQQQVDLDNQKKVQVIRDAKSKAIHPRDLVVGDIVRLSVGDIIPADGVLIDGADLKFDESALTGETNLVTKSIFQVDGDKEENAQAKDTGTPFIVSGTNVMHGSGKMLVTAVGRNSIQGKILARLRETNEDDSHPTRLSDVEAQEYEEDSKGCCSRMFDCLSGVKRSLQSFFTFGAGDSGGDLMEKLDILAVDIGKGGMIVAVLVFLVMVTRWFESEWVAGGGCEVFTSKSSCDTVRKCDWVTNSCTRVWTAEDLATILKFFITAITILVVAVPEGLPLAVTLSLAISMRRMTKDNNQVKHMDSCETMGSATTICSDKTGTLTENKMTVMRCFIGGKDFVHRAGSQFSSLAQVLQDNKAVTKADIRILCEGIILDSMPTSKAKLRSGLWHYEGNATECALLKLATELGYDPEPLRKSYKESGSSADWGVFVRPFSSERKRMSWVIRTKNTSGKGSVFRLFTKGAPQQVIDSTTHRLNISSKGDEIETSSLSSNERSEILNKMKEYQKNGMRTLCLGFRDFEAEPEGGWEAAKDTLESNITLIGLFGIEDPLRPSVRGAISKCRTAGIDVRMCTGDALTTAVAIAGQCGILRPTDFDFDGNPKKNFAMTGAEFDDLVHKKDYEAKKVVRRVYDPQTGDSRDMLAVPFAKDSKGDKIIDQAAFDEIWPTLRVLARCQPEDKLTLVRGMRNSKVFMDLERCQQLREEHNINIFPDHQVVAVTGDGTNDAPALKSADVGFAMGIVGTETAKQACDIILLDDNFSSIVKAVMWGRNVFDSISKFIQFQLTVNFVAIILAVIGAFTYNESPLSAVQMLWVNMIMDSLASLALATELPTDKLLDREPYGKRRGVITSVMGFNIVGHGMYQLVVLLTVLFYPELLPLQTPVAYEPSSGSLHWTLFFNVFVMLQLFNELNSRRLQSIDRLRTTWSEWNVFEGVFSNAMFVGVVGSTFILQILIVQFGGIPVNLKPGGLDKSLWIFSLGVGAFSLVWQLVINVLILIVLPGENRAASRLKQREDEKKMARRQTAMSNWHKARLGIRRSRVYARAFGLSLNSGVKLNTWMETSDESIRRQESFTQIARQLSSQFACA